MECGVGVPEFNWGIITEIDRAEAYGVAYNLKYIVTALLLAMVFSHCVRSLHSRWETL